MKQTLLALLVFALAGCSSTFISVHDIASDAPISGAHIVYFHMRQPYFIVGTMLREEVTTDKDGNAILKNTDGGGVSISAPGYDAVGFEGDYGRKLTIFLTRTSIGR